MTEALEYVLTLFPEPVLRKVADPVESFDDELAKTVEAMFELMFRSSGVGLAAPQVGLGRRILILNETGDREKPDANLVLINPTLKGTSGPRQPFEEGCLSFPDIYAEIHRPEFCKVEAYDVQGNKFERDFEGFQSRIVQHEHDHLEGVLLVDRMSPADKVKNKAALEELVYNYKSRKEG